MRGLTLVAVLSVTSCAPAPPPPSSRPVTSPVAATVTSTVATVPAPVSPSVQSLDWPLVPTTRIALHNNIWIETERSSQDAAALMIGSSFAVLGSSMDPAAMLPGSFPKQPTVAWQRRDEVKHRTVIDMEVV